MPLDEKLRNAYILPKSLGIIFGSFLILVVILIGYLTFELMELKNENFEQGQLELHEQYFLENPEFKEGYENWLLNQNIP